MHSPPNGEQCGGPGFYPFEIHVFSILDHVLSFTVMLFGSFVKNNKLRGFAVSFKAVESEIAEEMVKAISAFDRLKSCLRLCNLPVLIPHICLVSAECVVENAETAIYSLFQSVLCFKSVQSSNDYEKATLFTF